MKIPKKPIRLLLSFITPISNNTYTRDVAHLLDDIETLRKKIKMLEEFNGKLLIVIEGLKTSDAQHSQLETTVTLELQALYLLINNKKTAAVNNDPAFE